MVTKKKTQICQFTAKSKNERSPAKSQLPGNIDPGRGGGGTPYNGLYGEAPPERDTFFRLQVYERVGILLIEVYKRVGESVIWVCERAQRAEQMNFMAL